ncbi:transcriptional regulator family: Helix-loop-helix [Trichoderma aggressivum f. europaeum]|uniref:Transcriptional regulator family: Helix-loop-helix n=1 Tax=Trichoderma aggressivum f. europaeum TaxID=173218 RepID=A0AAE1I9X3_9HYPO|nr:transcriptional regulator family: Helix-loop-helix [Trichoderma aggressivum f. europaeum]
MPRPALPPTPGSSSDIRGKDGVQQLSSLQLAFELPPPAIHDAADASSRISPVDSTKQQQQLSPLSTPSLGLDAATSPKTVQVQVVYPMQAAETVKSRRRSSAAAAKEPRGNAFALPPPPTRSRKIIQMKPRTQDTAAASASASTKESSARAAGKAAAAKTAAAPGPDAGAGAGGASAKGESKKKQPSATSAAGRKIARKTAHSLIERRRRSKMNEEFALLKSMIPACTGEMHKLAILQASIEYVRYLEDCVAKLKAQQEQSQSSRPEASHSPLPPIREFHPTFHEDPAEDVEMTDSEAAAAAASPVFAPQRPSSVSPALHAQDSRHRHRQHSYSSVSTDQRHYSYSASTTTSPAFGPQMFAHNGGGGGTGYTHSSTSASGSTLTSPALLPQTDLDHEATAALLMLNSDRRGTAVNNNRALSVRDLLSS